MSNSVVVSVYLYMQIFVKLPVYLFMSSGLKSQLRIAGSFHQRVIASYPAPNTVILYIFLVHDVLWSKEGSAHAWLLFCYIGQWTILLFKLWEVDRRLRLRYHLSFLQDRTCIFLCSHVLAAVFVKELQRINIFPSPACYCKSQKTWQLSKYFIPYHNLNGS